MAAEPHALLLLSDGSTEARWSYLAWAPSAVCADVAALAQALAEGAPFDPDGPPFQGGVAGLASYELGARLDQAMPQARAAPWPELSAGVYPHVLAFDHHRRRLLSIGRGPTEASARDRARALIMGVEAGARATAAGPLAESFTAERPPQAYEAAVEAVIAAIASGEIFQANIAQAWAGRLRPGVEPFDLLARLAATRPAAYAAYLRLPGLALVSNSPERFLSVRRQGDRLHARAEPIKGTRPRGADPGRDAALAAELLGSAKDRAENLMIVDLMRNDLARVCEPGTVAVDELCALRSLPNVHHLVSAVTGVLGEGRTAVDLFAAAFPPGSVTGAPKVQAMRVIARHEAPRGPYCGSLFWAGFDGALEASVLIRTVAFTAGNDRWSFEVRAGAGIVADSEPRLEREETEAKIAVLRSALVEP